MKAGHLHRVISEKPLDPFPQRLPDTMTQFDMVEAEREDFPQHLVAAGVTVGIPAGGEREHETGLQELQELQEQTNKLFVAWTQVKYQLGRKLPSDSATPELLQLLNFCFSLSDSESR